jgi:glucose-like phosphotransferase system IIB component
MLDKAKEVIKAYGGKENILNVDACITKLRIQVKDPKIVDEKRLMELGALGVTHPSSQSVYAVFGNEADVLKNYIRETL